MKLSEKYIDSLCDLHYATFKSRPQLEASTQCGCFYCGAMFKANEITEWCDQGDTALCPRCGVDSVLGDAQVEPLSPIFLKMLNIQFFGPGLNDATPDDLYVIDDQTGEKTYFHFYEADDGLHIEDGQ